MAAKSNGLFLNRLAAATAFGLTLQFLATLGWIAISWPQGGVANIGQLDERMGDMIVDMLGEPNVFLSANLYNVSFGLTALTLMVLLKERLSAAPIRAMLALCWISGAAALYVATGIVPLTAGDALIASADKSALLSIVLVTKGLLLAATFMSGVGLFFAAWAALDTRFVHPALCGVMFAAALIEMVEYSSPWFLILDPLLGTIWSLWLGAVLFRMREPIGTRRPATA
ncbi:MAG: hypothetical protein ABL957_00435 [Parvularculaceae bacterium]